jgi:hypothetical protein
MGEIIQFKDLQAARDRASRRADDHQNIERAVMIMRDNLASVAEQMRNAPADQQMELLERVEKLAGMIRYGMIMLGDDAASAMNLGRR